MNSLNRTASGATITMSPSDKGCWGDDHNFVQIGHEDTYKGVRIFCTKCGTVLNLGKPEIK